MKSTTKIVVMPKKMGMEIKYMAEDIRPIYHKLGHQLLNQGIWFCRNAFKLNPQCYTRGEILRFLNEQTGIPTTSISLADEKFYVESWDKWKTIIEYDLLDFQEYLANTRDCDNFALMFSARASLIYGLNSCATAFGEIYNAVTGKYQSRHAFNMIVVHEQGTLKLFLYEPLDDDFIQWQKGQENILKNYWKYKPDWLLCF